MSAAFVSADRYRSRHFDLCAFLLVASWQILTASPFILASFNLSFGSPEVFAVLGTYAFLLFFLGLGILVGGLVTLILSAFREAG